MHRHGFVDSGRAAKQGLTDDDLRDNLFHSPGGGRLFQLRSVLGRRTGNERPPFDPYSRAERKADDPAATGTVVTLPARREPAAPFEPTPEDPYAALDKVVPVSDPVNADLRRVKDADPGFDAKEFLGGVKIAYEMIVTAFAEGDRKTLRQLLSNDASQGFEGAIAERESRGERMQSTFVGIDKLKVVGATVREREVFVTVRIVSQLISFVVSASGEVVDGDREAVAEVRDVWTFARDTSSRDPNWKLVETQSEAA